jgi:hypothetical protein
LPPVVTNEEWDAHGDDDRGDQHPERDEEIQDCSGRYHRDQPRESIASGKSAFHDSVSTVRLLFLDDLRASGTRR